MFETLCVACLADSDPNLGWKTFASSLQSEQAYFGLGFVNLLGTQFHCGNKPPQRSERSVGGRFAFKQVNPLRALVRWKQFLSNSTPFAAALRQDCPPNLGRTQNPAKPTNLKRPDPIWKLTWICKSGPSIPDGFGSFTFPGGAGRQEPGRTGQRPRGMRNWGGAGSCESRSFFSVP